MKKYLLCLLLSVSCIFGVFAQISVNPQDNFYELAQKWQIRGIVDNLSPLRPYTIQECERILNQVLENGAEQDVEIAEEYLAKLNSNVPVISLMAKGEGKLSADEKAKNIEGKASVEGDLAFLDNMFSFGYNAGFTGRTKKNLAYVTPLFTNYSSDALFDPANLGPIFTYLDVNSNVSFTYKNFAVQAGINKLGYGDFINYGLALNDSAYHMPSFAVTFKNNWISYTQLMAVVGATTNSNSNNDIFGNKYLGFHAIEVKPLKTLSVSFYENVVFGNKFDISYLIPTTYMICQGFSGYNDSIMMGLRASYVPVKGLRIASDLLVDDLNVNQIAKLNFDSKNRIAWSNEVKYVFDMPVLDSVTLNYTMVTPFTYAHWDLDDYKTQSLSNSTINYQNYTNSGFAIGTSYAPNSDVIRLNVKFNPIPKLNINLEGSFLRHGNVVESLTANECIGYLICDDGTYSTDGSIFTHQYGYVTEEDKAKNPKLKDIKTDYFDTAWNKLNFLTQEDLMLVATGKINVDYNIAVYKKLQIFVNAGYCFEFVYNKGVDSNMYKGGSATYNPETKTYTYNEIETTSAEEVVNYYKAQWKSTLHNEINNYFNVGVTLKW